MFSSGPAGGGAPLVGRDSVQVWRLTKVPSLLGGDLDAREGRAAVKLAAGKGCLLGSPRFAREWARRSLAPPACPSFLAGQRDARAVKREDQDLTGLTSEAMPHHG